MYLKRFCVKCGALESEDNPIINGLCLKCLTEERELAKVEGNIHIVVCPVCSAYFYANRWNPGLGDVEETIEWLAERLIEQKLKPISPADEVTLSDLEIRKTKGGKYEAIITYTAVVKGHEVTQSKVIKLRVDKRPCPKCLRKSGKDYDATIQIRSEDRLTMDDMEAVGEVLMKYNLADELVEVIEKREGVDLLIDSKEFARRLSKALYHQLGAKLINSQSVVGQTRSGRIRTRLTISVRLPAIKKGEVFLLDGEPFVFEGVIGAKFTSTSLKDGRRLRIPIDAWWNMRKGGRLRYAKEIRGEIAEVVSLNPLTVKLSDEKVLAKAPPNMELSIGDKVKVTKFKENYYVVKREDDES